MFLFEFGVTSEITKAGRERKLVTIRYIDRKGDTTVRDVEPYEFKDDKFWAYDVTQHGIRQFKLDKIVSASKTNITFVPRFPIKL